MALPTTARRPAWKVGDGKAGRPNHFLFPSVLDSSLVILALNHASFRAFPWHVWPFGRMTYEYCKTRPINEIAAPPPACIHRRQQLFHVFLV
jgi:hypothetical protein